ncbi:MAG: helix-turn-helix domain-containing protein [Bdellovibrionaceae bacterium]|nr:helix-turn-helix domain-containing protein [Pseudobdellovibrionaceae bacterium]
MKKGIQYMIQGAQGFEGNSKNGVRFDSGKNLFFESRIAQEWLTTESAAEYLGISENALRIMVHRDQIRFHKLGRRLRFRTDELRTLFTRKGV